MAVACAAGAVLKRWALGVDLVFLIEGEEETGSAGFMETVSAHKVWPLLSCILTRTVSNRGRRCDLAQVWQYDEPKERSADARL